MGAIFGGARANTDANATVIVMVLTIVGFHSAEVVFDETCSLALQVGPLICFGLVFLVFAFPGDNDTEKVLWTTAVSLSILSERASERFILISLTRQSRAIHLR